MRRTDGLSREEAVKRVKAFWKYINKNDERYLFWVTFLYYLISTLNLNNKTLFVSLLGLWLVYHVRLKNIHSSLLFTALASLIYLVGKTWLVELISPKLLRSTDFPRGYIAFVAVTPFQIFASLTLVLIARDAIRGIADMRRKAVKLFSRPAVMILLSFFFWRILGALVVESVYGLPLIYSLQSLSYGVVFIGLMLYLSQDIFYQPKILSLFGAMAVFEVILSALQWLRRSSLGLAIEAQESILTYLQGPGQEFYSVRPIGTFSHPNELALFSLFMAVLFLPLLYLKERRLRVGKNADLIFFISATLTLILSLGRSAWIAFFICLALFLYLVEKKWNRHVLSLDRIPIKTLVYVLLFATVFFPMITSRAVRSLELFQPTGGGETRMRLIVESLHLIKQKPIFGAGMGLSGMSMFQFNPEGIISTFPSVVHNLYLLIASESGIPALTLFLAFIVVLLKKTWEKAKRSSIDDKIQKLGPTLVLLAALINGLIHQIFLMGFFLIAASLILAGQRREPTVIEGQ